MKRIFHHLTGLLFVSTVWLSAVAAADPLTTIKQIRNLTPIAARERIPVELHAQVVQVDFTHNRFFVNNGPRGLMILLPTGWTIEHLVKPGDVIQLSGVTAKGGFVPIVVADRVDVIDHLPLPEGCPFYDHERNLTTADGVWMKTRGRLISLAVCEDRTSILLEVMRNDLIVDVMIPYSKQSEKILLEKLFHFIEFQAVCSTVYNQNRQLVGRIFYATSADDFWLTETDRDFHSEISIPIHEVMRKDRSHLRPTKTHGLVTYVGSKEVYLRGKHACLRVILAEETAVQEGDEVEVSGFPWPQPVSPAFRARNITIIRHQSTPPAPVRIEAGDPIDDRLNYQLVEMDAKLIDFGKRFFASGHQQQSILCRADDQLFEVRYPLGVFPEVELLAGSTLRLRGICQVSRSTERRWFMDVEGFRIQLRGLDDISILVPPQWWTVRRLLWLLGVVFGAALIFLGCIVALRNRVSHQMTFISGQVERESILKERQRIARELHDNLAQGLVGMVIQLKGCARILDLNKQKVHQVFECAGTTRSDLKSVVDEGVEKSLGSLAVLREMMDHCSEESRSSILYLRSGIAGRMGLLSTLQEVLEPLAEEMAVVLAVTSEGEARALNQEVERNLMLVAKEAVTNALRHANPSRIRVQLVYFPEALQITVSDDGTGFSTEMASKCGHYGFVGMRERMDQLGGSLAVISSPKIGTEILIKLDDTSVWEV